MAKVNRYWRCNCDRNNSRITVKSAKEAAPICKKCGTAMKREGYTKNKTGTLKTKRQIRGETVSLTACNTDQMDTLQSEVTKAKRNHTILPWQERMIDWAEARVIFEKTMRARITKGRLTEDSFKKYGFDLNTIMASNALKGKFLQDVTKTDVDDFLTELSDKGLALYTKNQLLARVKHIYSVLCDHFDLEHYQKLFNAKTRVMKVESFRDDRNRDLIPKLDNVEEIEILLEACKPYPRFHFCMFGIIKLNLRIGAMKKLRVEDVDFDNDTFTSVGKGGAITHNPLPASFRTFALKWMEDYGISSGYFLRSPRHHGKPWVGNTHAMAEIREMIAAKLESEGRTALAEKFRRLTTHKIGRHTGASHQQYIDVDASTKSRMLGHSTPKTTKLYQHPILERQRVITEVYDEMTNGASPVLPQSPEEAKRLRKQSYPDRKAARLRLKKSVPETIPTRKGGR